MNVKFLAVLLLGYAAVLAAVAVTLTGGVSLNVPIRAIVREPASFPVGVIFTHHIQGPPLPTTLKATKEAFASTLDFRANTLYRLATSGTIDCDFSASPTMAIFTLLGFRKPYRITLMIAELMFRTSDLRLWPTKYFTTSGTRDLDGTLPVINLFASHVNRSPLVKTRLATKNIIAGSLQLALDTLELRSALVTLDHNSLLKMLIDLVLSLPIILAFLATKNVFVISKLGWSFQEFLSTLATGKFLGWLAFVGGGVFTLPIFQKPLPSALLVTKKVATRVVLGHTQGSFKLRSAAGAINYCLMPLFLTFTVAKKVALIVFNITRIPLDLRSTVSAINHPLVPQHLTFAIAKKVTFALFDLAREPLNLGTAIGAMNRYLHRLYSLSKDGPIGVLTSERSARLRQITNEAIFASNNIAGNKKPRAVSHSDVSNLMLPLNWVFVKGLANG